MGFLEVYFSGLSDKRGNDIRCDGLFRNWLLHAVTLIKHPLFRYCLATVCKMEGLEWLKLIIAGSQVLAAKVLALARNIAGRAIRECAFL